MFLKNGSCITRDRTLVINNNYVKLIIFGVSCSCITTCSWFFSNGLPKNLSVIQLNELIIVPVISCSYGSNRGKTSSRSCKSRSVCADRNTSGSWYTKLSSTSCSTNCECVCSTFSISYREHCSCSRYSVQNLNVNCADSDTSDDTLQITIIDGCRSDTCNYRTGCLSNSKTNTYVCSSTSTDCQNLVSSTIDDGNLESVCPRSWVSCGESVGGGRLVIVFVVLVGLDLQS